MKIYFIAFLIALTSFSCIFSQEKKEEEKAPEVNFNFEMNKVDDKEGLFSHDQKQKLESFLKDLEKDRGIKFIISTSPSKKNLNSKWIITPTISPFEDTMLFFFGKTKKYILFTLNQEDFEKYSYDVEQNIIEKKMIPSFEKGNYYEGVINGINEILLLIEN